MKYVGSKRRILKDILPIILKHRYNGQPFIDLMCGSAIVAQNVSDNKGPVIANDINPYLIELLRECQRGTIFPKTITEKDYQEWKSFYNMLRDNCVKCSKTSMAMIGFVGFCCSYGGKFWGGYARGNDSKGRPRNFADEQSRNLEKRIPLIQHVTFSCASYEKVWLPPQSLIYIDPPYKDTTLYISGPFYNDGLWEWCRKKRGEGHTIFVSEYEAPDDFIKVWEKPLVSSLTKDTGSKVGMEGLFILR
jgi:DNA adenine methylase